MTDDALFSAEAGVTDEQRIEQYADRATRHLPAADRSRRRAELVEHLTDAVEAGELDDALQRLGDPQQAATAFAPRRATAPAPFPARALAALIDNLPLVAVAIALGVQGIGTGTFAFSFPPLVYLKVGGFCASVTPVAGCGEGGGWLYAVGVPVALAWSILGLAFVESRFGTTPGKRLVGLRVTTESGLLPSLGSAVLRRMSFLLGPLAWLDWLPYALGHHGRLLDLLTGLRVEAVRA